MYNKYNKYHYKNLITLFQCIIVNYFVGFSFCAISYVHKKKNHCLMKNKSGQTVQLFQQNKSSLWTLLCD